MTGRLEIGKYERLNDLNTNTFSIGDINVLIFSYMNITDKYKKKFEANMLDGDKVEDCGGAMLSVESVWQFIHQSIKDAVKEAKLEILEEVKNTWNETMAGVGTLTSHQPLINKFKQSLTSKYKALEREKEE